MTSNEKFISAYAPEEAFIMEMSAKSLNLLAQMIHLYSAIYPNSEIAKKTLHSLVSQSDCVFLDAKIHGVYTDKLTAPAQCVPLDPILYLPFE